MGLQYKPETQIVATLCETIFSLHPQESPQELCGEIQDCDKPTVLAVNDPDPTGPGGDGGEGPEGHPGRGGDHRVLLEDVSPSGES